MMSDATEETMGPAEISMIEMTTEERATFQPRLTQTEEKVLEELTKLMENCTKDNDDGIDTTTTQNEDEMDETENDDEMEESESNDEMDEVESDDEMDETMIRLRELERLDNLCKRYYERYVVSAPLNSWIKEYYRTVLYPLTNGYHYLRWKQRCAHGQPLPPKLVRYVSVGCNKYVQGAIRVGDEPEVRRNGSSRETIFDDSDHRSRYVCCMNKCAYVEPYATCNFCAYLPSRTSDVRHQPCLCDCLAFRYCITWRGEYVRRMRTRYSVYRTRYASFSDRVAAFDIANPRLVIGSFVRGTKVTVTTLVGCVLAAMGLAPFRIACNATGNVGFATLRCHRCFSVIESPEIASSTSSPAIVEEYDETKVSDLHLLSELFAAINETHARADPFCPYVMTRDEDPDSNETAVSRFHKYSYKFRHLTLYTTRFNLPGYGRRLYMWNVVPVLPTDDALFDPRCGVRHVFCEKYRDEREFIDASWKTVRESDDSEYDVLVNAKPCDRYPRAVEFYEVLMSAKRCDRHHRLLLLEPFRRLYPNDDRNYDRCVRRACSRLAAIDERDKMYRNRLPHRYRDRRAITEDMQLYEVADTRKDLDDVIVNTTDGDQSDYDTFEISVIGALGTPKSVATRKKSRYRQPRVVSKRRRMKRGRGFVIKNKQ